MTLGSDSHDGTVTLMSKHGLEVRADVEDHLGVAELLVRGAEAQSLEVAVGGSVMMDLADV